MATLNVSLPRKLKNWIAQQVEVGRYSSASDYLRDLIREDIRDQDNGVQWLANQLKPLLNTPDKDFITVTAKEVKSRARRKIED